MNNVPKQNKKSEQIDFTKLAFPKPQPQDGLRLYYRFDSDLPYLFDYSGNGFIGIPTNAQRVTNGEGRIAREMALGSRRLDLCVEYRGHSYAVEVKTAKNFAGEKSYAQLAAYLDTLGLAEGWMAVFDTDTTKPWEEKLYRRDVPFEGKTIHVIGL